MRCSKFRWKIYGKLILKVEQDLQKNWPQVCDRAPTGHVMFKVVSWRGGIGHTNFELHEGLSDIGLQIQSYGKVKKKQKQNKQTKKNKVFKKTGLAWQGLQSMGFSKLLAEGGYDILILKVEQDLLKTGLKCAAGPTRHGRFNVISWREDKTY